MHDTDSDAITHSITGPDSPVWKSRGLTPRHEVAVFQGTVRMGSMSFLIEGTSAEAHPPIASTGLDHAGYSKIIEACAAAAARAGAREISVWVSQYNPAAKLRLEAAGFSVAGQQIGVPGLSNPPAKAPKVVWQELSRTL